MTYNLIKFYIIREDLKYINLMLIVVYFPLLSNDINILIFNIIFYDRKYKANDLKHHYFFY